ncbi:exosortase N [Pontibacter beigongshangensis]|uniref:exosortase N n=1 Tax=Pontibacter beigongshangensis TaxID=2574733 RepID=UPI00164FA659|nr:exosortase N [Pontibacter beigongshangensis]
MQFVVTWQRVGRQQVATAALAAGYLLLGFIFLKDYLLWDMPWLLALALLPLVAQAKGPQQYSLLKGVCVFAMVALAAYTQAGTVFFFAWVLALWWSLGSVFGSVGIYPVLLLLLGSPIFRYISNILSFPLRLQLTEAAVQLLQLWHLPAEAAGNVILLHGEEFAVDPACAGLSMLAVSLLLAVFLLAHLQKRGSKDFPNGLAVLLLGLMLLLNLGCNLLRILLLVLFRIMPDHPLHDLMGLLCLLLYAVLPFYLLARSCYSKFGVERHQQPQRLWRGKSIRIIALLNLCLLLSLLVAGVFVVNKPEPVGTAVAADFEGFEEEQLDEGVLKFTNRQALVYLKPIRAFYSTEHHPLICWEGSGYLFRQVRALQVGSTTVYTGELHHADEKLYTAWWMDNGSHQTIDQWDWRWRMLRGEAAFNLVNVTVAGENELTPLVAELLGKQRNLTSAIVEKSQSGHQE